MDGLLPPKWLQGPPFDVVAVGENSIDLLCVTSSFPAADNKQPLLQRLELPGGQATTAAVGCARLGLRSCYVGAVGDDANGARVRETLEREGVAMRVVTRPGVATRNAVVLIDAGGRRSVLSSRDRRLDIAGGEIDDAIFTSAKLVLVDGSDLQLSHRAAAAAREAGVPTMCDLDDVSPDAIKLLELIDIVIVRADFVRTATGEPSLTAGLRHLAGRSGAEVVVVTDGANGAIGWSAGRVIEVKAEPVRVVDTTGAGDAFRAGFGAAWLGAAGESLDLIEMVRFAARVAALNCRDYGAQTALPTRAEAGLAGEGWV